MESKHCMALEVLQHFELGKVRGVEVLDIHFVVAPILVAKLLRRQEQKMLFTDKKQGRVIIMANIIK